MKNIMLGVRVTGSAGWKDGTAETGRAAACMDVPLYKIAAGCACLSPASLLGGPVQPCLPECLLTCEQHASRNQRTTLPDGLVSMATPRTSLPFCTLR